MGFPIAPPFPVFVDADGQPLDGGYVYLGVANQNPQTNPIAAYWDAALTVPAAQPLRTDGGFIVRNGTPAAVWVNSDFSTTVRDVHGNFVYTNPTSPTPLALLAASTGAGLIGFSHSAVYSQGTVGAKLKDYVSVKDAPFNATGDGSTDDAAAIQAALDSGAKRVYIPAAEYLIQTGLTVPSGVEVIGYGYNNTQITNDSNDYAFTLTNCAGSRVQGLYIYSEGTDGADKGILIEQSGTGDSRNNVIAGVWFNGHVQGLVGTTTHRAIYISEAASGYANYWHQITGCVFQLWNTCILGDYNGNACFLVNCEFEGYWYGIKGTMQQWSGVNLWFHTAEGSGSDYTYCIDIDGDGVHQCAYNSFEFTSEPGLTLSRVYRLGSTSTRNKLSGMWQAAERGSDSGSSNLLADYIAGTITFGGTYVISISELVALTKINDINTNVAGTVSLFGDGTNAHTGTGQQKVRLFGGNNETRYTDLWQEIGGKSRATSSGGGWVVDGAGGEVELRDGADGAKVDDDATAGNTRLLLYDVDNGQYERVSVGSADSGGSGYKLLRIPN